MEPGKQMADRHASASGEDEKQHERNRMRDIHTDEKQPGKLKKTVRLEQEVPK